MVPMATSEVREAVRDYLQKHEYPTIAGFIDNHVDLIVPNTPSNKSIDKFWTSVIYQEAKKLNKTLSKSRVSWKKLFGTTTVTTSRTTSNSNNSAHRGSTPDNSNIVTSTTTTSNNNESNNPALTSAPINNDPVIATPTINNNTTATSSTAPNNNSNSNVTSSPTNSTASSSLGKRSRSSSAKTGSCELTPAFNLLLYLGQDNHKIWPCFYIGII